MCNIKNNVSLTKLFLGPQILTLEQLCKKLQCSQPTVFRKLSEHGYYSSYNHTGKFYTIPEVPNFDSNNLWMFKDVRFSKYGSLKETVCHFVKESKSGKTHAELFAILAVRCQNTLLSLVHENKIQRDKIGSSFVYLNSKRSIQRKQKSQRIIYTESHKKIHPSYPQKIATLLELIKKPKASRREIVFCCQRAGVDIDKSIVDEIFEQFDLDKKRAL